MNQTVSCSRHPTACFCFCHLLASFPRIRLAPLPALMSLSTTVCFPSVLVWWPNRDLLIFTRFCTCYSLICLYFVRNLCFRFHRLVPDQIICLVFYRLLISVYFAIWKPQRFPVKEFSQVLDLKKKKKKVSVLVDQLGFPKTRKPVIARWWPI